MIPKIYLKRAVVILFILFILTAIALGVLFSQVNDLKEEMNTKKNFNDKLYDTDNLVIIHVDEKEEYCRNLIADIYN